jgi:mono/diheme cytochrome c family protein
VTARAIVAAVVAALAATGAIVGWGTTSSPREPQPVAGAALDGETLFRTKGCASCHSGPAGESVAEIGPDLADAAVWAGDRRPEMSAEEYLAESVRNPGAFISPAHVSMGGPTTGMPELEVSDGEVEALVSYLMGER